MNNYRGSLKAIWVEWLLGKANMRTYLFDI